MTFAIFIQIFNVLANLNSPAERIVKFSVLDTGHRVVEFLAKLADLAVINNHNFVFISELAYRRNNGSRTRAEYLFEFACFLSLDKLVNGNSSLLNLKTPLFAKLNCRISCYTGKDSSASVPGTFTTL